MEEKKKYEKIDVEVAEQTLRDDLDVTGGSGVHTNAGSENESRDYGKYVIIATLVVLAAVAIVLAII